MPGAGRQFLDMVGLGGKIIPPVACTVTIEGNPVVLLGSGVTPHAPTAKKPTPHQFPQVIITGSCTVTAEGRPIARAGDIASCGCSILIGSCTVNIGI